MPYCPTLYLPSTQISKEKLAKASKIIFLGTISAGSSLPFAINSYLLPDNDNFWRTLEGFWEGFSKLHPSSKLLADTEGGGLAVTSQLCNTALNYKACEGFLGRLISLSPRQYDRFTLNLGSYLIGVLTIFPSVSSSFVNSTGLSYVALGGAIFSSAVYADSLYNLCVNLSNPFAKKADYRHAVIQLKQVMGLQSGAQLRAKLIHVINQVSPNSLGSGSELAAIEDTYRTLTKSEQTEVIIRFMLLNNIKKTSVYEQAVYYWYRAMGGIMCAVTAGGSYFPAVKLWHKINVVSPLAEILSVPGTVARFILFESSWNRFYFKLNCLGLLNQGSRRVIACSGILMLLSLVFGFLSSTGYLNTVISSQGMQAWYDAIMSTVIAISTAIITILNGNALYDFLVKILRSCLPWLGEEEMQFVETALDTVIEQTSLTVLDDHYERLINEPEASDEREQTYLLGDLPQADSNYGSTGFSLAV